MSHVLMIAMIKWMGIVISVQKGALLVIMKMENSLVQNVKKNIQKKVLFVKRTNALFIY